MRLNKHHFQQKLNIIRIYPRTIVTICCRMISKSEGAFNCWRLQCSDVINMCFWVFFFCFFFACSSPLCQLVRTADSCSKVRGQERIVWTTYCMRPPNSVRVGNTMTRLQYDFHQRLFCQCAHEKVWFSHQRSFCQWQLVDYCAAAYLEVMWLRLLKMNSFQQ